MPHRVSEIKVLLMGSLTMALAIACGGTAFSGDDGPEGGKGGEAGSSSSGGKIGTAGSSSAGRATGGSGTGGSSSSGGKSSGGSASGGSIGWPEQCTAPPLTGNCDAYFQRWYHDPSTGICKPFVYGGCGGNANNYESLAECQQSCAGGSPNYDACQQATDCTIGGLGCCGTCDGPGADEHGLIAYATKHQNAVYKMCDLVDIACSPCLSPLPYEQQLKYFIPDCVQGACVVHDIRKSAVTACKTEQDCRLRSGTQCCEGCGGAQLVSVANNGILEKLVCGDIPQPCPAIACAPSPGGGISYCDAGHCSVAYAIAATD